MELDPALRCAVCQRPLELAGGRLRCAAVDCPLVGQDQDSCCGGAPLTADGPTADQDGACARPPPPVRWTPDG
jgi:hypothetical protein